jgi:hypothetical protein
MTGYTMLSLHVWLLVRRLKEAGDEGKYVTQVMYDQFQRDTELRVHGIGIQVRARCGQDVAVLRVPRRILAALLPAALAGSHGCEMYCTIAAGWLSVKAVHC